MNSAARHRCMIYADPPEQQIPYIASLLLAELQNRSRCVYLNNPDMVASFRACLTNAGLNVDAQITKGTLVLSSDRPHLAAGRFDAARMLDGLATLIHDARADGFERLWVTGDMTWEFGDRSNFKELLAYERGLEQLFQQHPMLHGVCQYRQETLPTSSLRDALCAHQSVYLNQTLFRLNPYFTAMDTPAPAPIPTEINDLLERFRQHQ